MSHVINPLTGRKILIGGPTYKKVFGTLPKGPSLEKVLKKIPKTRESKVKSLKSEMKKLKEGRGERTRGWRATAPQKGKERHELKRKCGDKCFLLPGEEKFPVCPSLRYTNGKCQVDCRGVTAALVRARQYGYPEVAKKAVKLEKKYKC